MKLNFLTQLSQILKGEVFNVELPSISGECKGIEYRITKWTVENVEFSRFNLNLEGGELKLILEGIRLYTRMHFKAWSKKIEKLKSSFDPTCEIKQFDYTISLRTTDNNVVVTQCNANIGSLTLGTENKGLKKTVFDQVRTVANLDKIAKGKLIKFLVDNMGKYIAKKLQDKLFSMNTKQNVETESKVIAKPKPPTPLSYITKCMLCETNFGLFMKKVSTLLFHTKSSRITVAIVEAFTAILVHQILLHQQIMDSQNQSVHVIHV